MKNKKMKKQETDMQEELIDETDKLNNDCTCDDCDCSEFENICECDEHECNCECEHENCCNQDCLENDYKEIANKANEYLELAQRVQAEFDNYRKRINDSIKQAEQKGLMKAVEKLLPVVDSINNAKIQVKDEEFKKAIEILYNQVIQIFSSLNVKKIDALGKEFNPHLHYAVLTEEVEGVEPGMVIEELQEGFEVDDKVIRYSVVKVSK